MQNRGTVLISLLLVTFVASLTGAQAAQIVPYSNSTQLGYHMINISTDTATTLVIGNYTLKFTQNYITPGTAGVTINNASYYLNASQTISISGYSNVYIKLVQVNYIPRLHTVDLNIYQNVTTTTTTTTIPSAIIAASSTICNIPNVPAGCSWVSTPTATAPCAGHVSCPASTTITVTVQPTTTMQQQPQSGINGLIQQLISLLRSIFSRI